MIPGKLYRLARSSEGKKFRHAMLDHVRLLLKPSVAWDTMTAKENSYVGKITYGDCAVFIESIEPCERSYGAAWYRFLTKDGELGWLYVTEGQFMKYCKLVEQPTRK